MVPGSLKKVLSMGGSRRRVVVSRKTRAAAAECHSPGIPVGRIRQYEHDLRSEIRERHPELLLTIRSSGAIPSESDVSAAISQFTEAFKHRES